MKCNISEESLSTLSCLGNEEEGVNSQSPEEIRKSERKTLHLTCEELHELSDPVNDLVLNLGTELINEIQAEENFPPDYLKNVIEKVTSIKVRYDTAKSKTDKISSEMEYSDYHRNFENQLQLLTTILRDCEAWLNDFSVNNVSKSFSGESEKGKISSEMEYSEYHHNSIPYFSIILNGINIFLALDNFQKKRAVFESHNATMLEIMNLSKDTDGNPFSISSFGSTSVKEEIDRLSSKWTGLEAKFNVIEKELLKAPTILPSKDTVVDETAENDVFLEPVTIMEKELENLRMQHKPASNLSDISINLKVARLSDMISQLKEFENLREELNIWIEDVRSDIGRAKQNVDKMADEAIILQDEQFFVRLLEVILIILRNLVQLTIILHGYIVIIII